MAVVQRLSLRTRRLRCRQCWRWAAVWVASGAKERSSPVWERRQGPIAVDGMDRRWTEVELRNEGGSKHVHLN